MPKIMHFYPVAEWLQKIKVIVLDRDGVINEDSPEYIKSPDEWHAIVGSLSAIARLNRFGYKVVVASNQSGIARGYFSMDVFEKINLKMQQALAIEQGYLDGIFICPHGPNDRCYCRKPNPGLLLQIAQQSKVTPDEMLLIGDSTRDIVAAHRFGCKAILVKTGNGVEALHELMQLEEDEKQSGNKDSRNSFESDNLTKLKEIKLEDVVVFDDLAQAVDAILQGKNL